jgi:pyrroline-5-carboxylate reductase
MGGTRTVGFIGGGRVARIMLGGWARTGHVPERVVVSDPSAEVLADLARRYPSIETACGDNRAPSRQEIVFLALHPPAIGAVLAEIAPVVDARALIVSLAPKLTLDDIGSLLGQIPNLARVIPNAPSIVNAGYNPVAFAPKCGREARHELLALLRPLGECPEVPEAHLEAYAILTAMGPTYLWFQLGELLALSASFGLELPAARAGLAAMVGGAISTMMDPAFTELDEVVDLIPVKPLAEDEGLIRAAYRTRLTALHARLAPRVPAAR